MKAISLWQPWASAVALGSKRVETRSWSTPYRGPIAIHAAKRCRVHELIGFKCCWNWCGALGLEMGQEVSLDEYLPFGALVATAVLVDCKPTDEFTLGELRQKRGPKHHQWTEEQMGDFRLGRFGWLLDDIKPLDKPISFRGRQRLFEVPDSLLAEGAS